MSAPLVMALLCLQQGPPALRELASVRVELPLVEQLVEDVDGDGRGELLLVARDGRVQLLASAAGEHRLALAGELRLPEPLRCVFDLARLDAGSPGRQLVFASPEGLFAWSLAGAGGFEDEPRRLARRAKFDFRTNAPRRARIAQDVNEDGHVDVVLPVVDACELWLNSGPSEDAPEAGPRLRRTARVPVEMGRWAMYRWEELSNVKVSSFTIPDLATRDVNGDGRPDLLVDDGPRRSFHLQSADGVFPTEPSVSLDLSIFRDTTEAVSVAPGRTLALAEEGTFESRDINADGIPDYVISHRRKVWVFLGGPAGPQFTEPVTILKTAEDVTALALARLGDDPLPDLVLFKVQVPTVATLVRGLFGEWDVEVGAVGYDNDGGKGFGSTPGHRARMVVRLPSIVGILKNPGDLLQRFEELRNRFRIAVQGDLDGDGSPDLALVSGESNRLDLWLSPAGGGREALDSDAALREVFFESQDEVWSVDRILMWLGGLADRQVAVRTGGREPSSRFELRDDPALRLATLHASDLDGDGRDELVLGYRPADGVGPAVIDVVGLGKD